MLDRNVWIRCRLALAAVLIVGIGACTGDDGADTDDDVPAAGDTTAAAVADTQAITVADAGLETPESVLHDENADVYLVSNINGQPTEKDGNGFISRIRPDGTVDQLKWIDGEASDSVTLHAPKGLALKGDTLFVTDIDTLRAFHRATGAPLAAWEVSGATFLNDLGVGADGTVYFTDSGLNPDFSASGTDAVYRLEGGRAEIVVEGTFLSGPNGVASDGEDLVVAPFSSNRLLRIRPGADSAETLATLPGGQLDGVVRIGDGALLVSSWETQTVYRVDPGGNAPIPVVEGVPSPADIGWDARRQRVLIPVFTENRLEFRTVR